MKRIYLDQNKWIDLAACEKGLEKYARFRDVLTIAAAAVDRRLASFPLSTIHYIETSHRRRRPVGSIAAALAGVNRARSVLIPAHHAQPGCTILQAVN
jgi:hypothetical protein